MNTTKIKTIELKERVKFLKEEQSKEYSPYREINLKQIEEELKKMV